MFFEYDEGHDWSSYDFVVVGAGIAGLYLAERLSRNARVLVIEAGGTAQPLDFGKGEYEIDTTGRYLERLGSRLLAFGGTSNHWGGQSRALSRTVFENRRSIAGWPIAYEDFAAHLPDARAWLRLPEFDEGEPESSFVQGALAGALDISPVRFDYPAEVPQLGYPPFIDRFRTMAGVDVLLEARVSDIHLDADGARAASLEITDRRSGLRHLLPVRSLILSAGGIENARLMQWAGRKYGAGNPLRGGPNELTGRYFMEHPVIWPLQLYLDGRADLSSGANHLRDGRMVRWMWSLSDDFFDRNDLLRFGSSSFVAGRELDNEPELEAGDSSFLSRASSYKLLEPSMQMEQSPQFDSYVGLSTQLDRHGDPIAQLHWAVSDDDLQRYQRAAILFGGLLSQTGLARARLRPAHRDGDWSQIVLGRCHHHMGTTRMAHSRFAGVVDGNCRVFGLENMHVAGCSVFPNGDFVNPTYGMVALAARLAAHIEKKPVVATRLIEFSSDRPSRTMLTSGWSNLEEMGVWSDGSQAELVLDTSGARQFRLTGRPYGETAMVVEANGVVVFQGPGRTLFEQNLPLDGSDRQRLVFRFENLKSPKDWGENDDTRLLGLFLRWIELK